MAVTDINTIAAISELTTSGILLVVVIVLSKQIDTMLKTHYEFMARLIDVMRDRLRTINTPTD